MNVLILGGSQFVGKHITDQAIQNGHNVTLFNRGKTSSEKIEKVEYLIGDRDGNLDTLKGKSFDVVIDVNGYLPRIVKQSVDLLLDTTPFYIFISTISVYNFDYTGPIDINSPLVALEDETVEVIDGKTYGGLKVLCEDVVLEAYGEENCAIIRPGFIVGPNDHTDRFAYWVKQSTENDKVLVPDNDDQPMQFIDARDLANWTIDIAEKKQVGIVNAIGPSEKITFTQLLNKIKEKFKSTPEIIKLSQEFCEENNLAVKEFPLLFSHKDKEHYNLMDIDPKPSIALGLKHRSIDIILDDVHTYIKSLPSTYEYTIGLTAAQYKELISKL